MKKLARKSTAHVKEIPDNRVKELRKKQNLSLAQLEEMTKIELSVLSRIENRQRNITAVELILLSHHLKATPQQVLKVDFGFTTLDTVIDQVRMDGVVIALSEAFESIRAKPAPEEFSQLISFLYQRAVVQKLSLGHVRELAKSIVKVGKKGLKADPVILGKAS